MKSKKVLVKDRYNLRFGDRLYFIRSCLNLKQDVFASILEVKPTRYQKIESGLIANEFALFIWIVDRIRVFFGIDVYTLISEGIDKEDVCRTVRTSWSNFQNHSELKNQLLAPEMYAPVTLEQKRRLKSEKRLKKRKDAKKIETEDDDRLLVNVRLGDRIKFIRQAIHKNQPDLADSLCISEDRVSTLERGMSMRNFSILIRLLLIFQRIDISLGDLIGEHFDRAEIKKRVEAARTRNRSMCVIKSTSVIVNTR